MCRVDLNVLKSTENKEGEGKYIKDFSNPIYYPFWV